jgi:hypothetical protein
MESRLIKVTALGDLLLRAARKWPWFFRTND